MSLAPPSVADLAAFTGKDSSTYTGFAVQALAQATLLLYFATGLTDYPSITEEEQLARNGIMDMADKIYWSQPYREALASPFQSESIGSYSYSKMLQATKKGDNTGVMWFDLAVSKLKGSNSGIADSGSISGMEWDGVTVDGTGKARILGATGNHSEGLNGAWEIDTATDVTHFHPFI